MSSLMWGSSAARSTRSDLRKLPGSAGGLAASAAARSSSTGRTGWIRKIPGLVWAAATQASNTAEAEATCLDRFLSGILQCYPRSSSRKVRICHGANRSGELAAPMGCREFALPALIAEGGRIGQAAMLVHAQVRLAAARVTCRHDDAFGGDEIGRATG